MSGSTTDAIGAADGSGATVGRAGGVIDGMHPAGTFAIVYRDTDGREVWRDTARNLWPTAGRNFALDTLLAGSGYTATPFIGLIASTSYSALAAGDTMASHAGWLEAGGATGPAYSEGTRRTPSWNAAASGTKATSAGVVFTFTAAGTIKGAFIATSSTKDGTAGTLLSEALFTGGDQPVSSGGTLTVSYSVSLT